MDFFAGITGMVQLELVSAELERTLLLLNTEGIELYKFLQIDILTGRFWIRRKDLPATQRICRYMEGTVQIISKRGLLWILREFAARPVLLAGMAVILALYWYLPKRVLFVKVEGNQRIPSRLILAEAENCGIKFGAARQEVRSEKVKNQLLERIPELQWTGINTTGCVATISVRERQGKPETALPGMVSSLFASRDGYVLSATATRGSLLVEPGQTVKSGQMLISGFTDCGICIRAERAEGEVYAQTNHTLKVQTILDSVRKHTTGMIRKKISLLLGKKRINLWKDSGISVDSCGRMYEEYYITLPGGFTLPVALCVETFPESEYFCERLPEKNLRPGLSAEAKMYLNRQMTAGRILNVSEVYYADESILILKASYICRELISGVRLEQIGETHGENN